jgi:hypothetical protein
MTNETWDRINCAVSHVAAFVFALFVVCFGVGVVAAVVAVPTTEPQVYVIKVTRPDGVVAIQREVMSKGRPRLVTGRGGQTYAPDEGIVVPVGWLLEIEQSTPR